LNELKPSGAGADVDWATKPSEVPVMILDLWTENPSGIGGLGSYLNSEAI
jgi:hypothetical protein